MTRVYVAGPMTRGDRPANVRAGILAGERLRAAGFAPFVPHLTEFWAITTGSKGSLDEWIDYDLAWLSCCEALIRLPGESEGADIEVAHAVSLGIPIYNSVEEFLEEKALLA